MRTYTKDEAKIEALNFFSGNELKADVYLNKYALRDLDKFYEAKPPQTSMRLAKELVKAEKKFPAPKSLGEIYSLLMKLDVKEEEIPTLNEEELIEAAVGFGETMPQGSPTAAMGNWMQVQSLSNCFVIESPYDSYGGILHTDEEQAQIMKRRGGVGFDISTIRPKGCATTNAARTSDGLEAFMNRYSNTTNEVAQNGRRGALMLTISVAHPEIETFINIKRDKKKVTGANISIKVTDEFMQAVKSNSEYTLRFPVDASPETAKITKVVQARDIWEQIIDAAWYSAEPGILFWDTAIKRSPADAYAKYGYASKSTNPCAELILSPGDSCRLQVIDLRKFVKNAWLPNAYFDYETFEKSAMIAQRLMDDIVELEIEAIERIIAKVENDPEPEIIKAKELSLWKKILSTAKNGRRTGLGITALGDTLAMCNIKYGSDKSIIETECIYKVLAIGSYKASIDLAAERGCFPVYSWEIDKKHPFLKQIYNELSVEYQEKWKATGRRNIANLTTAPVGTGSLLLGCTSGPECLFDINPYKRRRKVDPKPGVKIDFVDDNDVSWQEYDVYHEGLQHWMDVTGNTDITQSPYYKACSMDYDWIKGVQLQAAAQKWICHSISRTTNLPKDASHDLISNVYMSAWENGCKGITVYRDGSRSGVLLTGNSVSSWMDGIPDVELQKLIDIGQKHLNNMSSTYIEFLSEAKVELERRKFGVDNSDKERITKVVKRPKKLECDIHRARVMVNGESDTYLVLVGMHDKKPYEIFCGLTKHVDLPRKYTSGWIVKDKNKKSGNIGVYNLVIGKDDDEIVFKDIVEQFDNPDYGAFSRVISLSLRNQVPIHHVVEQLQKDKNSGLSSWARVVARILKTYIPDGTTSSLDKICPECKSEGLVYQNGCPQCMECGWTKCQ